MSGRGLDDCPISADGGADQTWAAVGREHRWQARDPAVASEDLHVSQRVLRIVNLALSLGEPLLLVGPPGTGKTLLAHWIASSLGAAGGLLRFEVRSTSSASDLLYRFDAVEYLRSARGPKPIDADKCVTAGVFGRAIARTVEEGRPCVILVDGIDKGPRDLPNDLLRPIEEMEWQVPETGRVVGFRNAGIPEDLWPVILITSSTDRQLPAPFLRRCIHLHLTTGDLTTRLPPSGDSHAANRP